MVTDGDILEALRTVVDPELGVNIVDLGLIYRIEVGLLAAVLTRTGDMSRVEGLLEKLRPGHAYGAPVALATFHLVCSDIDQVADWTEKAIEQRHPAVTFFLNAHAQALRSHRRWPALVRMMNLPEAT